ncbi:hypothetical protein XENTR_v10014367 [Xenopus tropicalis]|nr:hypothetical protein XENTR_v10014367 [Xenopus tropicalis]
MSDTAVDASVEKTPKDLKAKEKEVVEEAENGKDKPTNGNAENEENGEQENEGDEEEEVDEEDEEDEVEGDDDDEDDEVEGATGKRAAEDDEVG